MNKRINIPDDFKWIEYLSINEDLTYINGKKEAENHYIVYGKTEGRRYKKNEFGFYF